MNQERVELQRGSRGEILGQIAVGASIMAGGAYLGWQAWNDAGALYWVGAVLVGFAGFVVALASTLGEAKCPACGTKHLVITEGEFEKCDECKRFLQGDDKAIWLVGEEHLCDEPTFDVKLDEESSWPGGCCVCGEEVTRVVQVELETSQSGRNFALAAAGLAVGTLIVRTGGGRSLSVEVPHCDDHDDGAKLDDSGALLLRSYPYYQEFVQLNDRKAA